MAAAISHSGTNSGFQAGVIHGDIGNVTIVQSETQNQECLRDLRTTHPLDDKERIKSTKGGLLEESYRWILDTEEFKQWKSSETNRLLWIRGDPGKGKTMLLCGIIEELMRLHENSKNASISFFFCQATDSRINGATSVLRGLIYLLVEKHPSLLSHIHARYDHAGKSLFEDVNAWNALSAIFKSILEDPILQMHETYLVIDALDECTEGLDTLLGLIVQESTTNRQIKWVVSSRNWPEIAEQLDTASQLAPISLELNEASVSGAVNRFIRYKVQKLAEAKCYSDKTRDAVQSYLLSNSQGTFLWVALVCQSLEKIRIHVLKKLKSFPAGLDSLYGRMIDQVRESEDAELCKQILAIMSLVFRPITLPELTSLVELSDDDNDDHVPLEEIIAACGSFLTLHKQTVMFVHQSAKEFLLKEAYALNEILPAGTEAKHSLIFARSLDVLSKTLKRDICNVKLPGTHADDIRKVSPNPLAAAEYACVYWIEHLHESENNEAPQLSIYIKDLLDAFLRRKFLYWLEALGILGHVSDGIQAMQKLQVLVKHKNEVSEGLSSRAQDAYRFIRSYKTVIESNPLQLYYSPLIFSPSNSLTRLAFQHKRPKWVLRNPIVDEGWSACLQTLEGHTSHITSIAWSPDRSLLASGSGDQTVRIWDPATGQAVLTLDMAPNAIDLISWSPDGSQIAIVAFNMVRICDSATGQVISRVEGLFYEITLISWSPDGSRLALGSYYGRIRIFDPATSQIVLTLEDALGRINLIFWSPDGSQFASTADDKTVLIWDLATGQIASTLDGQVDYISSISWSPDGDRLALGTLDMVHIWDLTTGQIVSTLEGLSREVNSISWMPDGCQLALGLYDMVCIWELATGQIVFKVTLKEGLSVDLLCWSPDGSQLASCSNGKALRLWDLATGQCVSTLDERAGSLITIAWSLDEGQLQVASSSNSDIVRIWDVTNSQSISTPSLKCHWGKIRTMAWSPDGSRLASGSDDKMIHIWDPSTGQIMSTLHLSRGYDKILSIAWSPDGSRLALGSWYYPVEIWDLATNQSMSSLGLDVNRKDYVTYAIAWSPDGSRLASRCFKEAVCIWDLATGQLVSTLEGLADAVNSAISWSPDGNQLATESDDNTLKIWDVSTSPIRSALGLKGHSDAIISVAWSPDGRRLASGSRDQTVRIWDLATGQTVLTLPNCYTSFVKFDVAHPQCLRTYDGIFDVGLVDAMTPMSNPPKRYGYQLSDDCAWITYNEHQVLWLPPDYRPRASRAHERYILEWYDNSIAIACSSNRVIFLSFSEQCPISAV